MTDMPCVLRLFPAAAGTAARERAEQIVDRLAAGRPVSGGPGEWRVIHGTTDVSAAMRTCEADLSAIDPRWLEVLDFAASRSHRMPAGRIT